MNIEDDGHWQDYLDAFEAERQADAWQAAQQADNDQRRRQTIEAWQRIKHGEYTESDLQVIETELRGIL